MRSPVVRSLLLAVLVAGCAVPAAFARKPTDPKLVPNAADVRIAHQLLLTKDEAGVGFTVDKSSSKDNTDCAGYKEPDLHLLTETADVDGPELSNKTAGVFVASSASVFISAGQALKAFQTLKAKAVGDCMLKVVKAQGMQNGRVVPIHLSVGSLEMFAWDLNGTMTAHGMALPFEMTLIGYRHSRALSMLLVAGIPNAALQEKAKELSARMTLDLLHAKL
ncbi:MAG TPA: hypothetical protein VE982_02050 [Gaiellaceae bacterium]|nr:hypothetical protein [Gaiellaceae bacterium]